MKARINISMQSQVDVEMTEARYRKLQDMDVDSIAAKQVLLEELGERAILDGVFAVYVDDATKILKLPKAKRAASKRERLPLAGFKPAAPRRTRKA